MSITALTHSVVSTELNEIMHICQAVIPGAEWTHSDCWMSALYGHFLEDSLLPVIFLTLTASLTLLLLASFFPLHKLTGRIFLSSVLLFYIFNSSLEVSPISKVSTPFRWLMSKFFLSSRRVHAVFSLLVPGCPKESWTQNIYTKL